MRTIYNGIIAAAIVGVIVYSYYNPIVMNYPLDTIEHSHSEKVYKKGDIIQPFKDFDLESGNYTAYVIVKDRIDLTDHISHAGVLKMNNTLFLKGLQDMKFEYTGGDMTTIENEFLIYHGDKLVFRSGILIEERKEGLQDAAFGWIRLMEPDKLMRDYIKDFDTCFPIAVLPK